MNTLSASRQAAWQRTLAASKAVRQHASRVKTSEPEEDAASSALELSASSSSGELITAHSARRLIPQLIAPLIEKAIHDLAKAPDADAGESYLAALRDRAREELIA